MSAQRLEWKVGLFVLVCLGLLGYLMLTFKKGLSRFGDTYDIVLTTDDVGGIQKEAAVRMAGMRIGQVEALQYDPKTLLVSVHLKIQEEYQIPKDSLITIETAGFLGDQYVSIAPQGKTDEHYKPGDKIPTRAPFNIQEAARAGMQLMQNVDRTVSNLNTVVIRVDNTLLSEQNLSNISVMVENLRRISDDALTAVQDFRELSAKANEAVGSVNTLVQTNTPGINLTVSNLLSFTERLQAVTNLVAFSENLNHLGTDLRDTVANNKEQFDASMRNLASASDSLKGVLKGLDSGTGLIGRIMKDPQMDLQVTLMVSNLSVLSSNLTRFGLLYKPKPIKAKSTNAASTPFPGQRSNLD